ncbi:cryptochrome/photolyase family protein [Bordetella sp. FB-8]|uniref:cryptochrome/photolyase family protein n=1 Tax=Bordetella sp. FB-8 TaxID=1159870 RepID=UPI00036AB617
MTALRLVLGDQLNPLHSWFSRRDTDVVYILMEVRQETDYVVHHAQKIIAIFAAMREFARTLLDAGHRVHYVALDDPRNRQSLAANLRQLVVQYQARLLDYQAPDEWRVDQELAALSRGSCLQVTQVDSEHFYTSRVELAQFFGARETWLMESFYRHMRQCTGVLVGSDGKPRGGRWTFDHDNRKSWRGDPPVPQAALPLHDHSPLWRTLQAQGQLASLSGDARAALRQQAGIWLDRIDVL